MSARLGDAPGRRLIRSDRSKDTVPTDTHRGGAGTREGNSGKKGNQMSEPIIDDGGPVFPQPLYKDQITGQYVPVDAFGDLGGMTLRDYFAAAALTGYLAASHTDGEPEEFANVAYIIADAMLKARNSR